MKKDKHPKYQQVVFIDSSTNQKFFCGSSVDSKERQDFEGASRPICRVSISSSSHPFFTGDRRLVDAEGRVSKFQRRYEQAARKKA